MDVLIGIGVVVAVLAALVSLQGAWRAQVASRRAADEVAMARHHAQVSRRQAETAEQKAADATEHAGSAARSIDVAREHLALARHEAGNVGTVSVRWAEQWRHGPVFGLLWVQAEGHHALHDVHLSIVAPRHLVGGVPAVAVLGDTPVDPAAAEERIGVPQGAGATLPKVLHTDVPVGALQPGAPWHAVLMCLSDADSIVFVMDWSVGPGRDRERARVDLALPPPRREESRG